MFLSHHPDHHVVHNHGHYHFCDYPFHKLITILVSQSLCDNLSVDTSRKVTGHFYVCLSVHEHDTLTVTSPRLCVTFVLSEILWITWIFVTENHHKVGNLCLYYIFFTLCVCVCCLLYTSPSPRDRTTSRMPSSA